MDERNEMLKLAVRWLGIALIVVSVLWAATTVYLMHEFLSFDVIAEETTYTYTQDGEGVNIFGDRNEVSANGPDDNDQEDRHQEAEEREHQGDREDQVIPG